MEIKSLKKCALCGKETELELSHIVPKMVVRTLKKTSLGSIRSADNPNLVVQDSEKHYMLCGDCEDLFNEYETYFANHMFHPYLKGQKIEFNYDDRLFYFLTSVSWRSLYWDLLDFVQNHVVGIDALECLIYSEKIMREYLTYKRSNIDSIENHIFFFDEIAKIENDTIGKLKNARPHVTFHRGITSYTFCYEDNGTYGTITNMMGIIVFTFYRLGRDEIWENTKIENGSGIIRAKNQIIQSVAGNELINILQVVQSASDSMSQEQQQKIYNRIKKVNNISESQIYKDWKKDNALADD